MSSKTRSPLNLQASNLSGCAFIRHAFFTRQGGCSVGDFSSLNTSYTTPDDHNLVTKNRALITEGFYNLPVDSLCTLTQKSSNKVMYVHKDNVKEAKSTEADALVTKEPSIILGVYTADCCPILLADTEEKQIAAIHAGHGGAYLGVVQNTVNLMIAKGSKAENIVAAIGPSIAKTCYQVQQDFYEKFIMQSSKNAKFFVQHHLGGYYFDLVQYVIYLLRGAGIVNIENLGLDTFSNAELFFSHRRATQTTSNRGLQLSSIVIK